MRLLSISLILLSLVGFSSCSTYQYITLSSPEVAPDTSKSLAWENDTMRLTYNFHGEGGPISITVFNKLDKPMYVNWKKSAFVRDGQAFSLLDRSVQFSGSYSGVSGGGRFIQSSSGGFAGSFDLPEGVNLVPPGSYITKNLNTVVLTSPVYSAQFTDPVQPQPERVPLAMGGSYAYKRYAFDQGGSPLQFRSYLTFNTANSTEEFFVSHSFYAREVLLSSEGPGLFGFYKTEGDQLFVKQHAQ